MRMELEGLALGGWWLDEPRGPQSRETGGPFTQAPCYHTRKCSVTTLSF